jgi:hypothetical protein
MHWKDGIDATLWPQAVTYATHVYNNTLDNVVCPADAFTGSTVPQHRLMDVHVWVCPLYVLYPKIQGQKLPRWEPQSRRGIFLGLSQKHASEGPLVLNIGTGAITTQSHVVFDDIFTTVSSIERETEPPEHWVYVCLINSTHIMVDSPIENLGDEWLNEEELEIKRRRHNRDERIREATKQRYTGPSFEHPTREPSEDASPEVPSETRSQTTNAEAGSGARASTPRTSNQFAPVTDSTPGTEGVSTPPDTSQQGTELRRSTRSTAGKFQTDRYADEGEGKTVLRLCQQQHIR